MRDAYGMNGELPFEGDDGGEDRSGDGARAMAGLVGEG
jgi:hypothetical protein